MKDEDLIRSIISLYLKHGWTLSRVLLSRELKSQLSSQFHDICENVPIIESDINAGWFSRSSGEGRTAWELRRFAEPPFALLEVVDRYIDETALAGIFARAEAEMRDRTLPAIDGHNGSSAEHPKIGNGRGA